MAKFDLDLKKFRHVKSDDKTTTLQHKDGHTITLHHPALSPDFQKQLAALSQVSKDDETPLQKEEASAKMASGGKVADMRVRPHNPKLEESKKVPPKPRFEEGGDVGFAGSRANLDAKVDPRQPAPGTMRDYHDKRSPEQDKQVQADRDKQNQAYRKANPAPKEEDDSGYKNYDEGGIVDTVQKYLAPDFHAADKAKNAPIPPPAYPTQYVKKADGGEIEADPNQVMTPMPQQDQPAPEQAQTPPAAQVQPNPYAEQYNKVYSQIMSGTPGTPPEMARQDAMSYVESMKSRDQASTRVAMEDQQMGHDRAVEENTRRQAIGLNPLPVPAGPATQPPPPTVAAQLGSGGPDQGAQQQKQADQSGIALSPDRDPQSMLESGYQNKMAGINQQATAQGQLGQQQAQVLDKNIEQQNVAKNSYLQSYQDLENERQAHMQDIKDGYIDPQKYWDNHSKVASGIGMILAGFNPTNSPNAAMNFLKFQMEQNLQSQAHNLNAKQNLLSANLHQFGNLRDAMDMTRMMQNDIMGHELQSAAAKAQTPMAKASALQAAGQLQMESAPMFQQFALRRAMMNLSNAQPGNSGAIDHMLGYMRVVNPEMAKEMQSRYVPGVGLASISVPDAVRSEMTAKQNFQVALSRLADWTKQNSGSISPSRIGEGRAMAANVQNLYREAINGGVFKKGEQEFLSGIVDAHPDKFFNSIRVMPKLNEVMKENDQSMNVQRRSYGLPQAQPSQPQYKTVNGVKYMRGPSGESIKVK